MKKIFLISSLLLFVISVGAQTVVNPFSTHRNEYNQKDFISVINDPGKGTKQQTYGYDWIRARGGQKSSTVLPFSALEYLGNSSDGYIVAESGNFNGDKKDDIFYLIKKNGAWTYGISTQDGNFTETDSLFLFRLAIPTLKADTISGNNYSHPCVTIGDFNGDGLDEAAIAWTQGSKRDFILQIVTADTIGGKMSVKIHSQFVTGEKSEQILKTDAISIGSGDLNGDGTDEIFITGIVTNTSNPTVIGYDAFIKVFDVSTDGKFTFIPKARLIYDNKNIRHFPPGTTEGSLTYIRSASIGFNPTPYVNKKDNRLNIFATMGVVWDQYNPQNATFDNIFTYLISSSNNLDTLEVFVGNGIKNNVIPFKYLSPFELKKGDINGDNRDEAVLLADRFILFQVNTDDISVLASNISPALDFDNNPYQESVDRFEMGDIDMDGKEDIICQTKTRSDDNGGSDVYWITTYRQDRNKTEPTVIEGGGRSYKVISGYSTTYYGFAIGNLDGNDVHLGEPKVMNCDYIKPTMILEAVPNHFDILNSVEYDINSCYRSDCQNSVVFEQSTETGQNSSVQVSSDWQVSAEVSSSFSYGGFGMEASIGYQYGERFEKVNSKSKNISVQKTVTAVNDDRLNLTKYPFQLVEYPVLDDAGKILTYIVAAFPDHERVSQEEIYSANSVYNYLPDHEIGNILSYPKPPSNPGLLYDRSKDNNFFIYSPSSPLPISDDGTTSLKIIDQVNSGLTTSKTTTQTISASVGANGFGLGGKVSGSYTESEMRVFGQTLTKTQAFEIKPINVIGKDDVWKYKIHPYVYWTREQAIKLGMAVDFNGAGTKWKELYGSKSDPALNMPYRFNDLFGPDYIKDNLDRTKSMYFDKINPNPGDTVTAYIKIFNYSLMSTPDKVTLSIYHDHPDKGGKIIQNLKGESIFQTDAALSDQGRTTMSIAFVVTNEMIASEVSKIYIKLDPNNEIDEVHEDNNVGYANLGYKCNDIITSSSSGFTPSKIKTDAHVLFDVYPNPAVDWVNFKPGESVQSKSFDISIYDISGRKVSAQNFISNSSEPYALNISNLKGGVYFYTILSDSKTGYSGKLLINN